MNARQRLNDLGKHIARVRGTTVENILEQVSAIGTSNGFDLYTIFEKMNEDVMREGVMMSAAFASMNRHAPKIESHHHDFVITVYNWLYHGGLLR